MVKLTLQKSGLVHDWFIHEPKAVNWTPARVYARFRAKVNATYGKGVCILSIVDEETGKVLWTFN